MSLSADKLQVKGEKVCRAGSRAGRAARCLTGRFAGLQEHPRHALHEGGNVVLRSHCKCPLPLLTFCVLPSRHPSSQLAAPGSAARIGWGSEGCDNDAPVGFNAFGWSIKSTDGCLYHRADSTPYARAPILNGDVIGCLLHLQSPVHADGARPQPSGGR